MANTIPSKSKNSSRKSTNLFNELNKEEEYGKQIFQFVFIVEIGRPVSSSRENLSKSFKDKLQPVSGSTYNHNDQAKYTPKTKEGLFLGPKENVQVKVKFSNKGQIVIMFCL